MKRIICILTALGITMCAYGGAVFAKEDNLFANGGFNEEIYGEGNWKFPQSGNWYTEGKAEKLQNEAVTNSGYIYQRVALEKGVTYELTLNIKADSECTPDIQFNDGAEEWPAVNSVKGEAITVGTDLKKIAVEFEAPNTQDYVVSMGTWEVGEGNNYISNPDFECDRKAVFEPVGWRTYDNIGGTANKNTESPNKIGNYVWEQSANEDYTADLSQIIENLPDGTYTLKARVRSSGGQRICRLYAGDKTLSLKNEIPEWTEIVIPNIEVYDGQLNIGLYSDSPANTWAQIDNMSLVKNIGE